MSEPLNLEDLLQPGLVAGVKSVAVAPTPAPACPGLPYTYDTIIAHLIEEPGATPEEVSAAFNRPKGWFLAILASEQFQLKLNPHRHLIFNTTITATMEERFRGLALHSLSVLHKKLDTPDVSDMLVLKAAEIGVKALGMGAVAAPAAAMPTGDVDSLADRLVAALEKQKRNVRTTTIDVDALEVVSG